jgi:hypothetical protein
VTFDDFLPPQYITNAEDMADSAPTSPIEKITRVTRKATLRKMPGVVTDVMRHRTSSPRSSVDDEKRHILDDRSFSPLSYVDEKQETLYRSNSNASSYLTLPAIDTRITFDSPLMD